MDVKPFCLTIWQPDEIYKSVILIVSSGCRKGKFHAGLKLHVAFSLKKQSFEHISVTQAVDSERAQVLPERYRNVLFIMDAGHCGHELENKIVASGNHFLIKGKSNAAG